MSDFSVDLNQIEDNKMKRLFLFVLLMTIFLFVIILTGCQDLQMTGSERTEDFSALSKTNIITEESKGESWNCHGWSLNEAAPLGGFEHEVDDISQQDYVEQADGPQNGRIIEWQYDHSAYIEVYVGSTPKYIYVSEYLVLYEEAVERGYYEYGDGFDNWDQGEQHGYPNAGEVQYWWRIIPPPHVTLDIDGPTTLYWYEKDDFYADAEDGWEPYSNYKWWWRLPEGAKGGKGPPPGEWQYLDGWEGESVLEWGYEEDFEIKCQVWDRTENNNAIDTHYVNVIEP